jgi:hypothetical protein
MVDAEPWIAMVNHLLNDCLYVQFFVCKILWCGADMSTRYWREVMLAKEKNEWRADVKGASQDDIANISEET